MAREEGMEGTGRGTPEAEAASAGAGEGGEEPRTLEERLGRLEEIVRALEADDVELDRTLALFEEGVRHIRAAEELLSGAELRVEELLGEGEDAATRPLDGQPGEG